MGIKKYWWPLLALSLLLLPFGWWHWQAPKEMGVVILDKTVPTPTYREHQGLMWLLNNQKIYNRQTGSLFQYDRDYYGFFPLDNQSYNVKELPEHLDKPELIYVADTYGVYSADFYGPNLRGDRSHLLYGGLQLQEVQTIRQALNPGNVLVAEFNCLASPTGQASRRAMEDLLGLRWRKWTGRYFKDLSTKNQEIPLWLVNDYERQYHSKWAFTGPGVALVREDDQVIILRQGKEIGGKMVQLEFNPGAQQEFAVPRSVPYYYWFDLVEPRAETQVLANYRLDLKPTGAKLLAQYGLPGTFPGVLRTTQPYHTYYFAGDFVDFPQIPSRWDYWGLGQLRAGLTADFAGEQNSFFWRVYYPLMMHIIQGTVSR